MRFKTIPFNGELTEVQTENVLKLIAALKSGLYRKAKYRLVQGNTKDDLCYCASGVAAIALGIQLRDCLSGFCFNNPHGWIQTLKDGFGFNVSSDHIVFDNFEYQGMDLISLNDNTNLSFSQIADILQYSLIDKKVVEFIVEPEKIVDES